MLCLTLNAAAKVGQPREFVNGDVTEILFTVYNATHTQKRVENQRG